MNDRVHVILTFTVAMDRTHLRAFNAGMLLRGFDCEALMSEDGKTFTVFSDTNDEGELAEVLEWFASREYRTLLRPVHKHE